MNYIFAQHIPELKLQLEDASGLVAISDSPEEYPIGGEKVNLWDFPQKSELKVSSEEESEMEILQGSDSNADAIVDFYKIKI